MRGPFSLSSCGEGPDGHAGLTREVRRHRDDVGVLAPFGNARHDRSSVHLCDGAERALVDPRDDKAANPHTLGIGPPQTSDGPGRPRTVGGLGGDG